MEWVVHYQITFVKDRCTESSSFKHWTLVIDSADQRVKCQMKTIKRWDSQCSASKPPLNGRSQQGPMSLNHSASSNLVAPTWHRGPCVAPIDPVMSQRVHLTHIRAPLMTCRSFWSPLVGLALCPLLMNSLVMTITGFFTEKPVRLMCRVITFNCLLVAINAHHLPFVRPQLHPIKSDYIQLNPITSNLAPVYYSPTPSQHLALV